MKTRLKKYSVGASVQWKWLGRFIDGTIMEIHTKPTKKIIKGKSIIRNGSEENPAYLVKSNAGNIALKLGSELLTPEKITKQTLKPKMFQT